MTAKLLWRMTRVLPCDSLPFEFGIPASKICNWAPLLHAVIGRTCLKRLDSCFAFTRTLPAQFESAAVRFWLGQEEARAQCPLFFADCARPPTRFTARPTTLRICFLFCSRCDHRRHSCPHRHSAFAFYLSSSLRCRRPLSRSPTICCSE